MMVMVMVAFWDEKKVFDEVDVRFPDWLGTEKFDSKDQCEKALTAFVLSDPRNNFKVFSREFAQGVRLHAEMVDYDKSLDTHQNLSLFCLKIPA